MKNIAIWSKDQIKQLKENAENNVVSFENIKKIISGNSEMINYTENHTLDIPMHYNITYTYEQQRHGILRHLSVLSYISETPPIELVTELMKDLGFINDIHNCKVWPEDFGKRKCNIINVIEPLDGNWEPHRK